MSNKAKWSTNYYIHVEGAPVDIGLLKRKVSQALNALWELDKVDAFGEIFARGVDAVVFDPSNKKNLTPEEMVVIKELHRLKKLKMRNVGLREIMEARGLDGFLSWAADKGVDCEEFLQEITLPKGKAFSRRVLETLRTQLQGEGAAKASAVVQKLIKTGLIEDTPRDRKRLADLASYYKLSSAARHGYWGWSQEAEAVFE